MISSARTGAAALAAWLLFAGPALAQSKPEENELTAAPGSIAYGMIENAGADGVFELVHDGFVTLRHVQSGLICRFLLTGEGGRLLIFPGLPRGEDVGCDQSDGHETVTLYATRYPDPRTLQSLSAEAQAAIEQRFPDARPHTPEAAPLMPPDNFQPPESAHARYLLTNAAGQRIYSRVSLAIIDGWVLKLRYSLVAPDDDALERAEIEANAHWAMAVQEFMLSHAT